MTQARTAAFANAAAREVSGAAKQAALAAGQAVAVSHVPAHELGAAAYAIRAARAAAPEGEQEQAGRLECRWQRAQLPARSENSCWTTRGCAMRCAGPCSIADRLARNVGVAR
jgi:hypothetical protein